MLPARDVYGADDEQDCSERHGAPSDQKRQLSGPAQRGTPQEEPDKKADDPEKYQRMTQDN